MTQLDDIVNNFVTLNEEAIESHSEEVFEEISYEYNLPMKLRDE